MQPASANRPRLPERRRAPSRTATAPRRARRCRRIATTPARYRASSRSERVISISIANDRLPPSAISAGQLMVCADGPQRDQHAAEADQDRAPAPPADLLAQHDRRQRGDEDRARQIIGDDVGERQIDRREEERRDLQRRQHHPQQLQPRPLQRAGTAARCRQIIGNSSSSAAQARSHSNCPTE